MDAGADAGPPPVDAEPEQDPAVLTGGAILGKLLHSSLHQLGEMGAEALHTRPAATALCVLVPALLYLLTQRRRGAKGASSAEAKGEAPQGPEPELTPEYEPVLLGELTPSALLEYDGTNGKAVCVAIRGKIYDCTKGADFYGPGGSYNLFAGKDVSRALAKMSFKPEDLNGNVEGLTASELDILSDWEKKFESKYAVVGTVKG